jgi:hypothetical protein
MARDLPCPSPQAARDDVRRLQRVHSAKRRVHVPTAQHSGGPATDPPSTIIGASVKRGDAYALSGVFPPLVAFGLVLAGVAIVDLGLLWSPLRFGTGEWEFGTASRTFDSLALGTTGFVFLVMAASARGAVLGLRVLAVLALVGFVALIGTLLLYWSNVPLALSAVPEQTRSALERSIARSTSFALLYIVLFGWLSWFTWRRASVATDRR